MNFGDELLTWFGNFLNFLILIYLIRLNFSSRTFDLYQTIIASIGLLVSILIHFYTSLRNK